MSDADSGLAVAEYLVRDDQRADGGDKGKGGQRRDDEGDRDECDEHDCADGSSPEDAPVVR